MSEPAVGVCRCVAAVAWLAVAGAVPAQEASAQGTAAPGAAPAQGRTAIGLSEVAVRLGGLAQVDGHVFLDDEAGKLVDELLVRRARLDLQAKLGRFSARLAPELGMGKAQILDAYVEARLPAGLRLRFGKLIPPISSERLQSPAAYLFVEPALSTNLAPTRDVGLQLSGEVGNVATFSVGVFDGAVDGGALDGDTSDDKDVAARVFVRPLAPLGIDLLAGLGVGVSGSWGATHGDPAKAAEVPVYKSEGLTTFFELKKAGAGVVPGAANTAWSSGRRARLGVQASWYAGPAAIVGEVLLSEQRVLYGDPPAVARLRNRGWQAVGVIDVTGERATDGTVAPAAPVDAGGWGALQIAVRLSRLDVDDDAFPAVADPHKAASSATSLGAGLSWWPVTGARVVLDYVQTSFQGGAGTPSAVEDRATERALLSRVQLAF